MFEIEKLSKNEVIDYIYNSKNLSWLNILHLIKKIYSEGFYNELILEKISPKLIGSFIEEFVSNYLEYANNPEINTFLKKIVKYILYKYLKLVKLDSVFNMNLFKAILLLDIPIKDKIYLHIKFFGNNFSSYLIKYLFNNVKDWNDILNYLDSLGRNYLLNLLKDFSFNLPDKEIERLDDKYLFLYSLVREKKLFSNDKNKDFLKFVISEYENYSNITQFIFEQGIEINKQNILLVLEIYFRNDYFYFFDKILESIGLEDLIEKIDEILNLVIKYLKKPESINFSKKRIKIFLGKLLVLFLKNRRYDVVINIILKKYDNNIILDKDDFIFLDDQIVTDLLSSKEIRKLSVKNFEKIIYFWFSFNFKCYKLVNIKFKKFYNRFVVYRFLKRMYKDKNNCDYYYDFLKKLNKNYFPFSTFILFYFIYWLYLKIYKKI